MIIDSCYFFDNNIMDLLLRQKKMTWIQRGVIAQDSREDESFAHKTC